MLLAFPWTSRDIQLWATREAPVNELTGINTNILIGIIPINVCFHMFLLLDCISWVQSVQFSSSVVSNSLWPHGLQHLRLLCPSPSPRTCSNSCPWSWWCHPTISSSVIPFSSCLQSSPESGSFPMSQFFTSGGQSIGALVSASVLPVNVLDWFPLGLTALISLQFKELSRVFSNTTVQKRQFFSTQLSL